VAEIDADDLVRTVGKKVAQLRRAKGWSQNEFASNMRVTVQWVHHLEQKGSNLTLHSLAKLANALGVPIAQMFEPLDGQE
jgi:transcriptional regulator with XRE-family HTH domain